MFPFLDYSVIVDFKTLKFTMNILLHIHSLYVVYTKAIFD